MKNSIYSITAYIPSDENIVVSDIKKICPVSEEGHCVIVSIKENHGVGTGIKYPGGIYIDEKAALLKLINVEREDLQKVDRMTLEEALACEKKFIDNLTQKLSKDEKT